TNIPAHYHEIAHAIADQLGFRSDAKFLDEGFAEHYASLDGNFGAIRSRETFDVEEALSRDHDIDYDRARIFAHSVVMSFGSDGLKDLLSASKGGDELSAAYSGVLGESPQTTLDEHLGEWLCQPSLGQCQGTPIPWDGSSLDLP